MTIRLGPQACGTLDEAATREWLVADGVGGYAMGTVAGLRTRRYHGLLVVAVDGPASRMLGLVALDPVLVVGDARFRLATDEWARRHGRPARPRAARLVRPRRRRAALALADRRRSSLERELAMAHGRRAVGVVHRLLARRPAGAARADAALHLAERPRRALRERRPGGRADRRTASSSRAPTASPARAGRPGGEWYRGVRAREEAARGLNDREDLWAAGTFARRPRAGRRATR